MTEMKQAKEYWESLTIKQQDHFLKDHKTEFSRSSWLSWLGKDFDKLPANVQKSIAKHVKEGLYKNGGSFAEFLAKAKSKTKSAYSSLSEKTKQKYSEVKESVKQKIHDKKKDIALDVLSETNKKVSKSDKKTIKDAKQIVSKKYDKGGYMAQTGKKVVSLSNKELIDEIVNTLKKGHSHTKDKYLMLLINELNNRFDWKNDNIHIGHDYKSGIEQGYSYDEILEHVSDKSEMSEDEVKDIFYSDKYAVGGFILGALTGAGLTYYYMNKGDKKTSEKKQNKKEEKEEFTDVDRMISEIYKDGFDYTFRAFSSFKEIKDTKFQSLRKKYVSAAENIEKYIENNELVDEDNDLSVKDALDKEGIDSVFTSYHNWKGVKDKKFKTLLKTFLTARKNLGEHLENKYELDKSEYAYGGLFDIYDEDLRETLLEKHNDIEAVNNFIENSNEADMGRTYGWNTNRVAKYFKPEEWQTKYQEQYAKGSNLSKGIKFNKNEIKLIKFNGEDIDYLERQRQRYEYNEDNLSKWEREELEEIDVDLQFAYKQQDKLIERLVSKYGKQNKKVILRMIDEIYFGKHDKYANGGGVEEFERPIEPEDRNVYIIGKRVSTKDGKGKIVSDDGITLEIALDSGGVKEYRTDEEKVMLLDKQVNKYAKGSNIKKVDLFEHYELIPDNVQKVLDHYSQSFEDGDYAGLQQAEEELSYIGYTFEYGLDGQAYALRPIGVKVSELEGYEEYAKGTNIGKNSDFSTPIEYKNSDEIFDNKGKAKAKYQGLYFLILSTKEGERHTSYLSNDKNKLDEIALRYNNQYSGVIFQLTNSRYMTGRTVYRIGTKEGVKEYAKGANIEKIEAYQTKTGRYKKDYFGKMLFNMPDGTQRYYFSIFDATLNWIKGKNYSKDDFKKGDKVILKKYIDLDYGIDKKQVSIVVGFSKDYAGEYKLTLQDAKSKKRSYVYPKEVVFYSDVTRKYANGGDFTDFNGVIMSVEDYVNYDKKRKGGNINLPSKLQEYVEKYHYKMSGSTEQSTAYWVDGITQLTDQEKGELFNELRKHAVKEREERTMPAWVDKYCCGGQMYNKGGSIKSLETGRLYSVYDPGMDNWNEWEYIGYTPGQHTFQEDTPGYGHKIEFSEEELNNYLENNLIKYPNRDSYDEYETPDVSPSGERMSNGGIIIGKTKSNKNVYAGRRASIEKDFTAQDHKDAAYLNLDRAVILTKQGFNQMADFYNQEFDRHMNSARYKEETTSYARGGGVTTSDLNRMIEEYNSEGRSFELRSSYGYYELWSKGNRLEVGSKKDIYNALVKYRFNDKYKKGGHFEDENKQMVLNNNKQIAHHTKELEEAIKGKHVPAWVVAKVNRSASDLSDATHYLDGQSEKFARGGGFEKKYRIYYNKKWQDIVVSAKNKDEAFELSKPKLEKIYNEKITKSKWAYSNDYFEGVTDKYAKGANIKIGDRVRFKKNSDGYGQRLYDGSFRVKEKGKQASGFNGGYLLSNRDFEVGARKSEIEKYATGTNVSSDWTKELTNDENEFACSVMNRIVKPGPHVDCDNLKYAVKSELKNAIESNMNMLSDEGKKIATSLLTKLN